MKNNAPFQYFECNSRPQFEAYVELRRRTFHHCYPGLSPHFGSEDATDAISHIVLASDSHTIVAGARLTISTAQNPLPLPMQDAGFDLRGSALYSQFALDRQPYAEVSRMAVASECARGFEVSAGLGIALCVLAARNNVDVLFSICPDGPARVNRRNAMRCGVGFHQLPKLPTTFGIEMSLCVLTGICRVYGDSRLAA